MTNVRKKIDSISDKNKRIHLTMKKKKKEVILYNFIKFSLDYFSAHTWHCQLPPQVSIKVLFWSRTLLYELTVR